MALNIPSSCSLKNLFFGNLHSFANGANTCPGLYKHSLIADYEAGNKTGESVVRDAFRLKLEILNEVEINMLAP